LSRLTAPMGRKLKGGSLALSPGELLYAARF
jgi:hypothetical protein